MLPSFPWTLTLREAFETAAQLNKEVKWMEFNGVFCKTFKLPLDRFSSFFKRRKSVEEMTHQKKNRCHWTSKIVKSTQSYSNGHFPYYSSLYYLLNLVCGVLIMCAETISENILNLADWFLVPYWDKLDTFSAFSWLNRPSSTFKIFFGGQDLSITWWSPVFWLF